MTEKEKAEISGDVRLYELGYHLVPTIAEEAVGDEVNAIKDLVEHHGGVIVSHEMPKHLPLAYEIPKMIDNKRTFYGSAYFGWMKFQGPADTVRALYDALEKHRPILRFILFKTVEEKAGRPPKRMKFFSAPRDAKKETAPKVPVEKLSEAEIDKTIEELVLEK